MERGSSPDSPGDGRGSSEAAVRGDGDAGDAGDADDDDDGAGDGDAAATGATRAEGCDGPARDGREGGRGADGDSPATTATGSRELVSATSSGRRAESRAGDVPVELVSSWRTVPTLREVGWRARARAAAATRRAAADSVTGSQRAAGGWCACGGVIAINGGPGGMERGSPRKRPDGVVPAWSKRRGMLVRLVRVMGDRTRGASKGP